MKTETGETISRKEAIVREAMDCGFQRFEAESFYHCLRRFKDNYIGQKEKQMKEDTETHLSGFGQPLGISYEVVTAKDGSYINFKSGDGFKRGLTNPLKIADGRTVGQAERDAMHEKLDAWIEENLK